MTTKTLTLTEFLLARITEDEERLVHEWDCDRFTLYDYGARQGRCDCIATARLEADCKAKRRIVAEYERHRPMNEWELRNIDRTDWGGYAEALLRGVLESLALPYADHPDYRQEWKP